MEELKPILFTVFEPSGDVLAASLITEIKRRQPGRPVFALGGPKMEAAGAELIETTTHHAKMGLGAVSEAKELLRRKKVLSLWLKDHDIAAHVPTDSPAANWSMCKAVRKARPEAKVIHLVGPQMWAWAPWRVGKLRRLTDHVMCLLPFEPDWFGSRGVQSTFVGHPLFGADKQAEHHDVLAIDGEPLKAGQPNLALLPGSRPKEIALNWPTMLAVYDQLRHRNPDMAVTIAAADADRAKQINQTCPGGRPPRGIQVVIGNASAVLDWADVSLTVSGTATLEAASRKTPMVVLYNANVTLFKILGPILIQTKTFALPNVIGESIEGLGRVVPEFVPHDGSPEKLTAALTPLLKDASARQTQVDGFDQIAQAFAGVDFQQAAADVLLGEIAS